MGKRKKKKSVGLTHPKGKYLRCSACGTRRMNMVALRKHQREQGCKSTRRRTRKKGKFNIERLKREGKLDGVSDKHVEVGAAVARVLSEPQEMRRYVRSFTRKNFRKRVLDYDE